MLTKRDITSRKQNRSKKFRFTIQGCVVLNQDQIDDARKIDHPMQVDEVYDLLDTYPSITAWLDEWNMEEDDGTDGFYVVVEEVEQ